MARALHLEQLAQPGQLASGSCVPLPIQQHIFVPFIIAGCSPLPTDLVQYILDPGMEPLQKVTAWFAWAALIPGGSAVLRTYFQEHLKGKVGVSNQAMAAPHAPLLFSPAYAPCWPCCQFAHNNTYLACLQACGPGTSAFRATPRELAHCLSPRLRDTCALRQAQAIGILKR